MRRAALAAFAVALAGCINDDIPPRPPTDGAAASNEAALQDSSVAGMELTELASSPGCGSMNLVLSAGTLFWTEKAHGTVMSVPTAGGSKRVIETGRVSPGAIAVDATSVYWADGGTKTVMKKPIAGGAAKVFVAATTTTEIYGGENDINALLAVASTLFVGRFTFVLKVPTAGGTPMVIAHSPDTDMGQPGMFALDPSHIYQTEIDHDAVSRETVDGSQNGLLEDGTTRERFAPDRIAVSQGELLIDALAVFDGNVIWANGPTILARPVDLGEKGYLFTVASAANAVSGFVVSGDVLFFGTSVDDTVQSVSLSTSPVDGAVPTNVLAQNQQSPSQFVADASSVYWRTADCRIMKLAK